MAFFTKSRKYKKNKKTKKQNKKRVKMHGGWGGFNIKIKNKNDILTPNYNI